MSPRLVTQFFLQLAITATFAFAPFTINTALADDDDDDRSSRLTIDQAEWSNGRDRLTVEGRKDRRASVTVVNAFDPTQVIGSDNDTRDRDWRVRASNPNPVPCRVRAISSDGQTAERDVSRAPANCAPKDNNQNLPPTANANGPYSGTTGVAVAFSSAGSNDPDGNITAYNWNFGDGGSSTQANPSHTYAVAGSFSVSLTVTDNDGATGSDSTSATIVGQPPVNVPPTANANGPYTGNTGAAVSFSSAGSSDSDGNIAAYAWDFGDGGSSSAANPSHTYATAATFNVTLTVTDNDGASDSDATTATIDDNVAECNPTTGNVSINSTSQNGCPEQLVPEQATLLNGAYRVVAINDLGMHCGDYDTRISSILPPFQVLLGQVIQRGATPTLNPAGVSLEYSAASNTNDPILANLSKPGLQADGRTYKTNFWDAVAGGAYDPFYPGGVGITPLATGGLPVTLDVGLPVPNVEDLYIGPDGVVNSGDESLTAVQHAMPGLAAPYLLNAPQSVNEHYVDKPFFVNFPFGYVAADVNWYEGAGIPFAAYDDFGRENAYPLVRVAAMQGITTVATVDTVLPISGEASCTNCHSDPTDIQNSRTSEPTDTLTTAGLPVAVSMDDPDPNLPHDVSVEYAADINILRLHDLKHGATYVNTAGVSTPCDVTTNGGNGDASCLINQALVQGNPVVCQVCHYTPALDLAQVGPVAGAVGTSANGRNQLAHSSNSNVMHSHHGSLGNLFPPMPAPIQSANGTITNQAERLAVLEETCYQCHPGTKAQCLRGAMFNGGMLCNDCHGGMEQVGADFSANVSPSNPGAFVLGGNFYDPNDPQPRVPWANEPGCGSCHTGDTNANLAGTADTITNTRDIDGNIDGLRLRQAYVSGDAKATPIVPTNKRFAEPAVPASFNGFINPGAGNPQLYRVSTGHGGVMCEGCHGATHAEWPNANPMSNDNVTANQLQGHTGAIVECGTCHTNVNNLSPDGSLNSLRGPHGLHAVGDTSFARGDHRRNRNENECRACHGQNGQGTVLSRMAADRVLECKDETSFCPNGNSVLFPKGHAVGCVECHENEL